MCFITITYPLYFSAPTGHLQVEYIYWLIPKDLFFLHRICRSCFGYQLHIYIVFCFGDFFAAFCMYVVDIIIIIVVIFFNIQLLH
jgi:hypothetical protein